MHTKRRNGTGKGAVTNAIRWTIHRAADEFGIERHTLAGKMKRSECVVGSDGCYSTQQIATVIFDDLKAEQIRKTRAEADGHEIANRQKLGQLVDVEEFCRRYDPVFLDVKRLVMSSKLTDQEKDDLLAGMAKLLEGK